MKQYEPKYIESYKKGILEERIEFLSDKLSSCTLCPRKCNVNRKKKDTGICMISDKAKIASYGPHFGEEAPLVGEYGSGTIFFSGCNLLCNFCQNFDISHQCNGFISEDDQLSDIMISLQKKGCHNINFVTPSHVVPQILKALKIAAEKGLHIPLVYNTSAYDDLETIRSLDGIIDIYMPDLKFSSKNVAKLTCNAPEYYENAKYIIIEMHQQVGNLCLNEKGVAVKGLLIRHLVMPNDFSGTEIILDFIANKISPETFVNVMQQYRPEGDAYLIKKISTQLDYSDYIKAKDYATKIGLVNLL